MLDISVGDKVKGVHSSGRGVRGKIRSMNGPNVYIDEGAGKITAIDIASITIVNGKKIK